MLSDIQGNRMDYIRGKRVLSQAEDIRIDVEEDQIEIHAEGLCFRVATSFGGEAHFEVAQEQGIPTDGGPLFYLKNGYTNIAWFNVEGEALKLCERLRLALQEQRALKRKTSASLLPSSSIAARFGRRFAEFGGIVFTSLVIAFVGGVVAYPGWQLGGRLFASADLDVNQAIRQYAEETNQLLPAAESDFVTSGEGETCGPKPQGSALGDEEPKE
ncbi:hypothetical protein ACNFIA_16715 [Pseudomonas sp. NY15437]|uniref:hypothetical protein n=1 Tax=Pseudomonas sp. NY15437 TaxID=3400360 RepID=UPI003A84B32D